MPEPETLTAEQIQTSVDKLFGALDKLASKLLYYDRKEDDELPLGRIEQLIKLGEVSVDDIVNEFRSHLDGLNK